MISDWRWKASVRSKVRYQRDKRRAIEKKKEYRDPYTYVCIAEVFVWSLRGVGVGRTELNHQKHFVIAVLEQGVYTSFLTIQHSCDRKGLMITVTMEVLLWLTMYSVSRLKFQMLELHRASLSWFFLLSQDPITKESSSSSTFLLLSILPSETGPW